VSYFPALDNSTFKRGLDMENDTKTWGQPYERKRAREQRTKNDWRQRDFWEFFEVKDDGI